MSKTPQQYIRPKDIDNRSTFKQRFIWRLETLAWDVIYWAPMKALGADRASNFLGWLLKTIGPLFSQNKTIDRNLQLAFPEMDVETRQQIAKAAWENVGRTAGELPHLPKIHPYEGDRVEVVGAERLDAIEAADQGEQYPHRNGILAGKGFVIHDQRRVQRHRASQRNPSRHPAGQLAGLQIAGSAQANRVQFHEHQVSNRVFRQLSVHTQRKRHVLEHR